eukprot:TRINITY_DN15046_c0_g1_i2.p1 TRINITY_DN15046_c0_g1~~TRINITY_DN15046_c0_g1_i2.p1  ORF type:complete len:484 (+),score=62.54 TRINITY_DN15046_c0_g1_i2:80-1531(+)
MRRRRLQATRSDAVSEYLRGSRERSAQRGRLYHGGRRAGFQCVRQVHWLVSLTSLVQSRPDGNVLEALAGLLLQLEQKMTHDEWFTALCSLERAVALSAVGRPALAQKAAAVADRAYRRIDDISSMRRSHAQNVRINVTSEALWQTGDTDRAIRSVVEAIMVSTTSRGPEMHPGILRLQAVALLLRNADPAGALLHIAHHMERFRSEDSHDPRSFALACRELAMVYCSMGQSKAAEGALEAAGQVWPPARGWSGNLAMLTTAGCPRREPSPAFDDRAEGGSDGGGATGSDLCSSAPGSCGGEPSPSVSMRMQKISEILQFVVSRARRAAGQGPLRGSGGSPGCDEAALLQLGQVSAEPEETLEQRSAPRALQGVGDAGRGAPAVRMLGDAAPSDGQGFRQDRSRAMHKQVDETPSLEFTPSSSSMMEATISGRTVSSISLGDAGPAAPGSLERGAPLPSPETHLATPQNIKAAIRRSCSAPAF